MGSSVAERRRRASLDCFDGRTEIRAPLLKATIAVLAVARAAPALAAELTEHGQRSLVAFLLQLRQHGAVSFASGRGSQLESRLQRGGRLLANVCTEEQPARQVGDPAWL